MHGPSETLSALTDEEVINRLTSTAYWASEYPGDKKKFNRYLAYKLEAKRRMREGKCQE